MAISFDTLPSNAVASGLFIEEAYRRTGSLGPIPQRIALLGQFNQGKIPAPIMPKQIFSADDVASVYGPGSVLHRLSLKLFSAMGQSPIPVDAIPLGAGTGTASAVITVTGSAATGGLLSLYICADTVPVAISQGAAATAVATAIAAAINQQTSLPVTATVNAAAVTVSAKCTGLVGNQITVKQNLGSGDAGKSPQGITVAITAMAGGLTDPDITAALNNFGNTWYTWVVCPFISEAALKSIETAGAARIAAEVKRPFAAVMGYTDTKDNLLTFLKPRNSPWITVVPVEGSANLPGEIAACAVGVCAVSAQNDPSRPFKTLALTGIAAGSALSWTYAQNNAIELAGASATYVDPAGVVRVLDLVTTYTTNAQGAVDESWRYTVTITNLQAKMYSLEQLFLAAPFDRAKIVDDNAVTDQDYAIRPKTVKAYIIELIDSLWIPQAWSKNRDEIVAGIIVEIDAANPGRVNVLIPDIIAVGLRILAIKYQWAFSAA